MKLLLLCLAILGVATASAVPAFDVHSRTARGLHEDWEDFRALIPVDKILEIVIAYLAEDSAVQAAVEYIQSDEFKALALAIAGVAEYKEFVKYLNDAGLNVYYYLDKLHEFLGIPNLDHSRAIPVSRNITGGMAGLVADIEAVLPLEKIKNLFYEKLATSPAFAELYGKVTSDEARNLYKKLAANEEWQWIKKTLLKHDIDIDATVDMVKAMLGW